MSTFDERKYADLLAAKIGLFKVCGSRWRTYKDGVWQESSRDIHRPLAYAVLPPEIWKAKHETSILTQLEGRFQADDSIFCGAIAWEGNNIAINTDKCIILVSPEGITTRDHESSFHFTKKLDVIYDPSATCPNFDATLQQSLPDAEDRELVQLCTGNFLYPDCRYEVCMVWYGEAGCGKSTLSEPFTAIFGDSNTGLLTRLTLKLMCDPKSYSLPKLRYACVNLGTELDSLAVDESANFKTIVSGEAFEAREIYDRPFAIQSHCKTWFLANGLPRFKNGTDAETRRMRFLRFQFKPQTPDVTLKSRLSAEKQGVFNFMLQGLKTLLNRSSIPFGGSQSRLVHERFRVSNDPLKAFIAEFCTLAPNATTPKTALYEAYTAFADRHSLFRWTDALFFRNLYSRYPEVSEVKPRTKGTGEQIKSISGISLSPNAPRTASFSVEGS